LHNEQSRPYAVVEMKSLRCIGKPRWKDHACITQCVLNLLNTCIWTIKLFIENYWSPHLNRMKSIWLNCIFIKTACEELDRALFLPHLSTKCLRWAFMMVYCPWSIILASVPACVNNFFKQHLLWNHWLDFDQTSQEWSLGGPLSKLFKPFQLVA